MPKNKKAWSSWNSSIDDKNLDKNSITYWLNLLQNLTCNKNIFLTLNPYFKIDEEKILRKVKFTHPYYDQNALNAQIRVLVDPYLQEATKNSFQHKFNFHTDQISITENLVK